jgi:hypothetical protein
MSKVTQCRKCNKEIPSYVQSVQSDPDAAEWVRGGFCSRKCHREFKEDQPAREEKEMQAEPAKEEQGGTEAKVEKTQLKESQVKEPKVKEPKVKEPKVKEAQVHRKIAQSKADTRQVAEPVPEYSTISNTRTEPSIQEKARDYSVKLFQSKAFGEGKIPPEATFGIITGVISLFIFGLILGTAAIVLGFRARKIITTSPDNLKGIGRANLALILGAVSVVWHLIAVLYVTFA